MKNMKHLLRLLGAVTLTGLSATTVVACGNPAPTPTTGLPDQVSQDLGVTNSQKEGLIEVQIIETSTNTTTSLVAKGLTNLTAANLLKNDGTAKSDASKTFLTNTLGLTANAEGKFTKTAAEAIKINAADVTLKPTITANEEKTDFDVTGGTFTFKFTKADASKTTAFTVNLATSVSLIEESGNLTSLTVADITLDPTTYVAGKEYKDVVKKVNFTADATARNRLKVWQSLPKTLNQKDNLTATITGIKKAIDMSITKDDNYVLAQGDIAQVVIMIGTVTLDTIDGPAVT